MSAGAWSFEICAWDQGIFAFPVARISALEGALDWEHTLVPTFRSISAGIHARYGAVQNKYEEQGLFHQSPDYFAWVAGTGVEFDSLSSSYRPPYDPSGISLKGGIEYEGANSLKFGGVSLSGSIYLGESTIAGRIGASIYGAWAPTGGVAFSPATRYLEYAGDHELSVADLPYPAYREYQACSELSAWYLYGEIKARLFSLELNWIMSNLFAPSLAIGAVLGSFISQMVWPHNHHLLILTGMIAFLTAFMRTPFTAFILIFEMTDRHNTLFPMMLSASIAASVARIFEKHSFYESVKNDSLKPQTQPQPQ